MTPKGVSRCIIAAVIAVIAGATPALASSAATTDDTSRGNPRVVEREYVDCIDGAPRSPDAHDRWVGSCRHQVTPSTR